MAKTQLLTADDLYALGTDCHAELVGGVLVPIHGEDLMAPAGWGHGETGALFTLSVGGFVRAHNLGRICTAETGFRLRRNPDTVRAPDFAFVARGRITVEMDQTRFLDLAPDLAVEVISPGNLAREIAEKVQGYLEAGVRLIWLAYPSTLTIVVHRPGGISRTLSADDELHGEDVLPGFSCRVADLFPAQPE